ncbi:nickel-responsive transcriptional regulator NikR [Roseomonas xinghualingensis]|uniref:nickel-responsive transcriptional regulator NikR n=1 Tax=Roseomonas xinghualingensis TaxID=2986475 RepID=UPI0021F0C216|nr:nickel-responsive transcriptional regulator NikR [Roseomonas sp. SXEYE001]MCV4208183.1 nickel-responsive transcriptional regulator NikR [Roseomonas sp. SXEYE001]
MQRMTIAIDDELASALDSFMTSTSAISRSEAIRDLVRRGLSARSSAPPEAQCYGIISCAVDQSVRNLAARVPQGRLDRHDLAMAALSVPLDHTTSVDVTLMRGSVGDVSGYAETLFLERGVVHGALHLIPLDADTVPHSHGQGFPNRHTHLRVRSGF